MNEKEMNKSLISDNELQNVVGGFVYKGVEYHTMADLRDALLRGLITEEDAQIIGKNIWLSFFSIAAGIRSCCLRMRDSGGRRRG